MLKEGTNNAGGSSSTWSRVCDTCRSAPCIVYCRADSAYLCSGCDARIHAANRVASRHERVWVCEACERAPAAFLRKADAASLCSSCDADIHSANPLSVPILPISGNALFGEQDHQELNCNNSNGCEEEEGVIGGEEEGDDDGVEAASWLLPRPVKISNDENESDNGFVFGGDEEVGEYLELVDCNNSCGDNDNFGTVYDDGGQRLNYGSVPDQSNHVAADSVVPVQIQPQSQQFQQGIDFDSSKAAFSCNGSISQSVSFSSLEVGVVPESTFSDVSISHTKPSMGTSDLFPPMSMPSLLTPLDRKARVLRYREKKKTRMFGKKIRYASRKAYAETRPRIKGRFAKRTDVEAEVDQMLSTTLMTEDAYGIVPSF